MQAHLFVVIASLPVAAQDADPALPVAGVSRSVLLVTWDTTRADRVGAYGCKAAHTPAFDALAGHGVLYEHAYAAVPLTLPSHTTILSGAYPCAHGIRDNNIFQVGPSAHLLPQALRAAGFKTGAFVATFILDPKFGLNQGFDVYDAPETATVGADWGAIERPAAAVAQQAIAFIDTLDPAGRFFLWVHFYDPHHPHRSPADVVLPGVEPYDAEIAACDRALERILERLRARGLERDLLTIVTADHGESLNDHGEPTHGVFLYEATMHVPLVVAPPPPGTPPGTRVTTPVSTADLAATILERVGIGRSALPDARTPALPPDDDAADSERAIYLESFTSYYTRRWHPLRAVVWKGFKFIEAPRQELYLLASDPGETNDLGSGRGDVRERMAARLRGLVAEHAPLDWQATATLSSEDVKKMNQFGYLAGATDGDPFAADLPDPKDRIGDLVLRDEAATLLRTASELLHRSDAFRTGRTPEPDPVQRREAERLLGRARAIADQLRSSNPRDPYIDSLVSSIELALGNHAAAVEPLERMVSAQPRNMQNHFNLAVSYSMTKKPDWALREMEKAVHLEPGSLFAHRWLVLTTERLRDWPAAAWWLDQLKNCPGQSAADLAGIANERARVQGELDKTRASPRAPAPVTDADLLPEGTRNPPPPKRKR